MANKKVEKAKEEVKRDTIKEKATAKTKKTETAKSATVKETAVKSEEKKEKKTAIKKTTEKTETPKATVKKPTAKMTEKVAGKETAAIPEATAESVKMTVTPVNSVLFVASESNPFAGTGGLADVIASLPKTLAENGKYDIKVVMPLYGDIQNCYREQMRFLLNFNVPLAWRNQYCGVFSLRKDGVTFYFIDNEYYFKRNGLYGFYDDGR